MDPADPEAVPALTGRIAAAARADEAFAAGLLRWAELHRTAAPATVDVISGQAQVRTAVRTCTVLGGIHLGGL
ncbi:hypothetical protein RM780_06880 [Streptomyces sp. DSM 44917]|uniref:Uncharacterized protein n=1 Tax=Streptomyces boetiae TaxID=3075541 RepID=A0ABU2L553_9ACTN|nr:hypothetical protein [Streptomyces sp. DSM 44917]MDT0306684.1 hypothetical protein [Streptomyces sp. DSM 44917]